MPPALNRILMATDFGAPSREALQYACEIANRFQAELHLLHVIVEPVPLPDAEAAWFEPATALPAVIQGVERQLGTEAARLPLTEGRQATFSVKVGYPVDEVMKYIDEHQVDLLVLGTQGHRGLSHLLLGSVAEKLVRLATCPVLTVHAPAAPTA